MTKQQLESYIKKTIREEVQREMQNIKVQILSELRSKPSSKQPVVSTQRKQEVPLETNIAKKFLSQYKPQQKPQAKYSSNSFLNELLASTQPLQPDGPPSYMNDGMDFSEGFVHGGGNYDEHGSSSLKLNQPHTKSAREDFNVPVQKNIVTADINGAPVNQNNPKVREVMDIMNRDYSHLVKKLDSAPKKMVSLVDDVEDMSWLSEVN